MFIDWIYQPHKGQLQKPAATPSSSSNASTEKPATPAPATTGGSQAPFSPTMIKVLKYLLYVYNFCLVIFTLNWLFSTYNTVEVSMFQWTSFAVTFVGCVIRQWSRYIMGRFFTHQLAIVDKHELVTAGPYSVMLHPGYTGIIMQMIGICMMVNNLLFWVINVAWYSYFMPMRVKMEERMLAKQFGDKFERRKKTVARFIPYIF
eukprot:gene14032-16541_t